MLARSCTIFKDIHNTSENLDLRALGVAFLRVFRGIKDTLVLMKVLVRVASSWNGVLLTEGCGCLQGLNKIGYDESRFKGGKPQLGV